MRNIQLIVNELTKSAQNKVLATIINVEGSAYLKEGTVMAFFEDSSELGILSGGCLENDLKERAEHLMFKNGSTSIEYDMMAIDEFSWGQSNGCNGKITILLEHIDKQMQNHFKKTNSYLKNGETVLLVKKITEPGTVCSYFFVTNQKHIFGNMDESCHLPIDHWLKEQNNKLVTLDKAEKYFVQVFKPQKRIIIFGAGPDVRPLVSIAHKTGFSVIVTDWREAYCQKAFFPDADELVIDFPSSFIRKFTFSSTDSIVIMTHNFRKDQEILTLILQQKQHYVGILGPRNRTERLFTDAGIPKSLHSPIGINIGAQGPEEIAVSIIAEIIENDRKLENQ